MTSADTRERVRTALRRLGPDLRRSCRDSRWLIGSAVVCLAGARVDVADLDLLSSRTDAARLQARWAGRRQHGCQPTDAGRFRTAFARYTFTPWPVEVMGALEVCVGGLWRRLQLHAGRVIDDVAARLYLPTRAELRRVLALFGRDKGRERAAQLDACAATEGP